MRVEAPLSPQVESSSAFTRPENREREISEKCGISGVFSKDRKYVSHRIRNIHAELQHRGTDMGGIAVGSVVGDITSYTGVGKIGEIFPPEFDFVGNELVGDRAIMHNRYGTAGDVENSILGAQPMIAEFNGRSIAIAFNGNIPEYERKKLQERTPAALNEQNPYNFDTKDIAHAIVSAPGETWEEKIKNGLEGVNLAYALTILTDEGDLYGLVGPSGHWPLMMGETDEDIVFASESRVDKNIKNWERVKPGELVKATKNGIERKQLFNVEDMPTFRCTADLWYLMREDSLVTENVTAGDLREIAGRKLAEEHPVTADFYAAIPESGKRFAKGYADELGMDLTTILVKKDDADRTYIAQNQDEVHKVLAGKFKDIKDEVKQKIDGKSVMLIDDSMIKGTTVAGEMEHEKNENEPKENPLVRAKGVIQLVREAGASAVHLGIPLPPFTENCDMGIVVRKDKLVALRKLEDGSYEELSHEQIAKRIGADSIHFLSLEGVRDVAKEVFGSKDTICDACIGGRHPSEAFIPTGNITIFEKNAVEYAAADGG